MNIREMCDGDLLQVLELEESLFSSEAWDREGFLYELHDNPYAMIYVAVDADKIIGFVDLWIMYDQAQIADIAVGREYQKKGIGQQLMYKAVAEAVKKQCDVMSLEVRVFNEKAIALYKKNDFINAGLRKKYYADGEDAVLMVKPLGGLNDTDISN